MNETVVFRMGRKEFAAQMVWMYGKSWILIFALLLVPALIAGIFFDIRWIIVFFMLLFLVAPMLLTMFYLYHGLRPVSASNAVDHKLTFLPEGVRVTLYNRRRDDSGEEKMEKGIERSIPYSDMKGYTVGLSSVVIPIDGKDKGFLWVPEEAFPDAKAFESAIQECGEGMMRTKEPNNKTLS